MSGSAKRSGTRADVRRSASSLKVAELRPVLDEFPAVGLRRGAAVPGSTKTRMGLLRGGKVTAAAGETPVLTVADARAWSEWLRRRGTQAEGVWLVLAKKGTTDPTTLTYEEALDEAICHGWVDGQLAKGDERTFRRKFTPRRSGGAWSKRNVAIATRLIEEGRMHRTGLVSVEQAKADGRWDRAYAGQATMEVPSDLAAALTATPPAKAMFERLSSANRYSVLYRLTAAKRAETRQRRIEQFVAMLARGETIHPQR